MPANPPASKLPLEAWVEFKKDKQRLNEYAVVHQTKRGRRPALTECFVECVDGEEFGIGLKLDWSRIKNDLDVYVTADGSDIAADALLKSDAQEIEEWSDAYVGKEERRYYPLKFNVAVQNCPDGTTGSRLGSMGTVVLRVREVQCIKAGHGQGFSYETFKEASIDEKAAFKLGSTVAISSSSEVKEAVDTYNSYAIPKWKQYKFVFKYRTRTKLQTLGIIPPDPASSSQYKTSEGVIAAEGPAKDPLAGIDLTGLDAKPGGIIALENAYKLIARLQDDNRHLRAKTEKTVDRADMIDLTHLEDD